MKHSNVIIIIIGRKTLKCLVRTTVRCYEFGLPTHPMLDPMRVKAGRIDEIPKAADIGPYMNIILHTGINIIFQEKKKCFISAQYKKNEKYT